MNNQFIYSEAFINFCHSAFDTIPIAIDFIDPNGKMIYINPSFSNFLKIPIEDMIGKKITDIDPSSLFMSTLKNKKADIAVRHKFSNGHDAICHRIPIYDKDGALIGGMGMILFDDVSSIFDKYDVSSDKHKITKSKYTLKDIVGKSLAITECKHKVKKYQSIDLNILISGESGVGKELFAHSIHNMSLRKNKPFISVNCSSIPRDLLEYELFGYTNKAFSGANKNGKIGKFELANGGTIFLDNIGDMSNLMQAKMLRVLQEQEVIRIGSTKPTPIDIRVISATNKDLLSLIEKQEFRQDLYYRLNVLDLEIPPLRKRKEDIPELIDLFLTNFNKKYGIYKVIPKDIIHILVDYEWKGNIRELQNTVYKICANMENTEATQSDIPKYILNNINTNSTNTKTGLYDILSQVEKELILKALVNNDYNKTKAAKILQIPRATLYRKIDEYSL